MNGIKCFAIVSRGFEKTAALEAKELSGAKNFKIEDGIITFEQDSPEKACMLAYRSQLISKLCVNLTRFSASENVKSSLDNLKQELRSFKVNDWSDNGFSVECDRRGNHKFNSHDFELGSCKLIGKNVNFKSPEIKFYCLINENKGYFGADVAGFDLSKRDYRIFGHSSDLKATAAYFLLRLSDYDSEKVLVDPFSRSGAIAIEAALFAGKFPVNYYRKDLFSFLHLKPFSKIDFEKLFKEADKTIKSEKLKIHNYSSTIPHLKSAEKNAKIAGVNKTIKFSRIDLESLDAKFDKEEVDLITSYPPLTSKTSNQARIKKLYNELFYQANYVLKKNGKVVLASKETEHLTEAALKNDFKLSSQKKFFIGEETKLALTFVKEQSSAQDNDNKNHPSNTQNHPR